MPNNVYDWIFSLFCRHRVQRRLISFLLLLLVAALVRYAEHGISPALENQLILELERRIQSSEFYQLHPTGFNCRLPLMRTSLAWIQPHPHGAILRHILNTINSFLCSSTNYLKNRLLPNDLIIVRNHGDDKEDVRDTIDVLESPRDMHKKVEIQTNSKFQSLTLSPTQSLGPPCIQIDAKDAYNLQFGLPFTRRSVI
jgi:hypothetical protein